MKTKLVLLLAAALVLGTAVPALAAMGKTPTKHHKVVPAKKPAAAAAFKRELAKLGIACPIATVRLKGSFGSAGDGFMAVVVSKATGKAAPLAGKQVALRLLHSTRILRNGGATVASRLKAGNHVDVVALFCTQGLVARTVRATARA